MAIYHLNAKVISRSAGRSATAAAAYRAGVKIKDERTGKVFDYTRKKEVSYRHIFAPNGSPEWATDRERLWNEAELIEKRKDAQVAREVEVALPIELTPKQRIVLLERFIQKQFVKLGMVADVAIHEKKGNPHAHILLTTRDISRNGFGQKNRDWNSKEQLEKWREQWAMHCNRRLLIAGRQARIDHRTLKAQGIDRVPTVHVGPTSKAMEERGIPSARNKINSTIKEKNMSDENKKKAFNALALVDEPQFKNEVQTRKRKPMFIYPKDWENFSYYRFQTWERHYLPTLQKLFNGVYTSIDAMESIKETCRRGLNRWKFSASRRRWHCSTSAVALATAWMMRWKRWMSRCSTKAHCRKQPQNCLTKFICTIYRKRYGLTLITSDSRKIASLAAT